MKLFETEITVAFVKECYFLSLTTLVLMVLLEAASWDKEWQQKLKIQSNRELYLKAATASVFHFVCISPVAYGLVLAYIKSTDEFSPSFMAIPGILLVQGLGYAVAHALMHVPSNYWIHKYHHVYNERTFVRPIVANAVTVTEFFLAYALPIVLGAALFRPSPNDMFRISSIISVANLLIHTPESVIPMNFYPSFLVTNTKHFHHHEKNVRQHYSAPVFDFDGLLNRVMEKGKRGGKNY
jgi:hypothetical protein